MALLLNCDKQMRYPLRIHESCLVVGYSNAQYLIRFLLVVPPKKFATMYIDLSYSRKSKSLK